MFSHLKLTLYRSALSTPTCMLLRQANLQQSYSYLYCKSILHKRFATQSSSSSSSMLLLSSSSSLQQQRRSLSSSNILHESSSVDIPHSYVDILNKVFSWKWLSSHSRDNLPAGMSAGPMEHVTNEMTSDLSSNTFVHAVDSGSNGSNLSSSMTETFEQVFVTVQETLGVDAWVVLLLTGAVTRLVTLLFSLYSDRASARLQVALNELKPTHEVFSEIYYNPESSTLDVHRAAMMLKRERKRIYHKHKTSMWQTLSFLYGTPILLYSLTSVSMLCQNVNIGVGTSSFYWCYALTFPDPLYILPITFCALTLLNFELSINKSLKNSAWMKSIVWGARIGCVSILPIAISFQSGVCLYFVSMSVVGLLQPLLLRWQFFRKLCKFPEPIASQLEYSSSSSPSSLGNEHYHVGKDESAAKGDSNHVKSSKSSNTFNLNPINAIKEHFANTVQNSTSYKVDDVQARVLVQFPYLNHLFRPLTDDIACKQTKLSANKGYKVDLNSALNRLHDNDIDKNLIAESGKGKKYGMGENPLMREIPLHPSVSANTVKGNVLESNRRAKAQWQMTRSALSNHTSQHKSKTTDAWKTANVVFDQDDLLEFYKADNDDSSDTSDTKSRNTKK